MDEGYTRLGQATLAELLVTAIAKAPLAVSVLDPEGVVLYANESFSDLTGLNRGEAVGRRSPEWTWIESDDRAPLVRSKLEKGEAVTLTVKAYRSNGIKFWDQIVLFPVGNQGLIVSISRDATVHKNREAQLIQANEYTKAVISSVGQGLFGVDQKGALVFMNQKASEILGWEEEELIGQEVHDFIHIHDQRIVDRDRCPLYRALTSREVVKSEELFQKKDKSWIQVSVTVTPIEQKGSIMGAVVVFDEMTNRKKFEAVLHEMARFNSAILSSIPFGIVVFDLNGAVEFANRAFLRRFNRFMDDVQGRILKDVMGEWLFEAIGIEALVSKAAESGEEVSVEDSTALSPEDGRELHFDVTVAPLPGEMDAPRSRFMLIIDDITDEKLYEKNLLEAARLETVGRLAGGIAHDYNNILTGILGLSELAMSSVDPASQLFSDLSNIRKLGQRAKHLTSQLLAFGRRQPISPKSISINELITSKQKILETILGEAIALELRLEEGLPLVHADPHQLEQILLNLTLNARDAIPRTGLVSIVTRTAELDHEHFRSRGVKGRPGRYALLEFSDNGKGIKREHQARIFEPFFSTKEDGDIKGSGLGLASVYGIVKQHDGFIWVNSEEGKGTTFEIYIPAAEAEGAQSLAGVEQKGAERGELKVLVVEDEPQVLDITTRMLTQGGFDVVTASSPQRALEIVAGSHQDIGLLITDVILPGMDGLQLFREIKKRIPSIKVVFMSGYTREVIVQKGLMDEDTVLIEKPFTSSDLMAAIEKVISGAREGG